MREIKFRAWDKDLKGWIVEKVFYSDGVAWIRRGNMLVMLDAEVSQYTGLKDKNGTPIYEGDVVKSVNKRGEPCIGYVEWMPHMLTYVLRDYVQCKTEREWLIQLGWGETEEVIGNIYEHPNLLQEKGKE